MKERFLFWVFCSALLFIGSNLACTSEFLQKNEEMSPDSVVVETTNVNTEHQPALDAAHKITSMVSERYGKIQSLEVAGTNRYQSSRRSLDIDTSFDFDLSYASRRFLTITWKEDGKALSFSSTPNDSVLKINDKVEAEDADPFTGLLNAASQSGRDRFEIGKIVLAKERKSGELQSLEILTEIKMQSDEIIDGKLCFVIEAKYASDNLINAKYWIDKSSYLILQYQRTMYSGTTVDRVSTTTEFYSYSNVVDQ